MKAMLRSLIYICVSISLYLGYRWAVRRILCWYRMRRFVHSTSRKRGTL